MTQAKVEQSIAADIEAVWNILGNFAGIEPGPGIEAVAYEGEGVGMLRTITLPNGTVVERLTAHDAARHTFTYAIINDDSPLPFADYSATVTLTAQDGGTHVDWTGTFEPRGVDEAKAIAIASGIYQGGIARAAKVLGG